MNDEFHPIGPPLMICARCDSIWPNQEQAFAEVGNLFRERMTSTMQEIKTISMEYDKHGCPINTEKCQCMKEEKESKTKKEKK